LLRGRIICADAGLQQRIAKTLDEAPKEKPKI